MHPFTTRRRHAQDEADIRRLIAAWSQALEGETQITSAYAPDALLFDAIPPEKTVGADNIRTVLGELSAMLSRTSSRQNIAIWLSM